ncbi:NEDD4-binding protein 2-like 1 [Echinococcus granulosus]|uniref:NEDD4 binding protein 2 1 n=1 Tax=Echinococcus granulosus TaxID=6210 RepID=A0A068WI33_ECHGR|nr:NEDD4-binding protein 2-like 1 [Echinococcus granulosus]CDS17325.1 NEDD4 binding protein 2 1 [Echinococcus granulosus]
MSAHAVEGQFLSPLSASKAIFPPQLPGTTTAPMSSSTNDTNSTNPQDQNERREKNLLTSAFTPLPNLECRMADFLTNREMVATGLLILLRGLPGSGKSKLANRLRSRYSTMTTVIRLDDHLPKWRLGTSLSSDSLMLADAHAACKQAAWSAMQSGVRFVVIDIENLKYSDMMPYVSEAINTNYEVHFVEPDTSWRYSARALARRNRRGLTENQLQHLLERFEQFWTAEDVVAELRRRKNASIKSPKNPAPCDPQLHNTASLDLQAPTPPISSEIVNPGNLAANLMKSLGIGEATRSSDPASSFAATPADTDAVARLHEMFPQLQLSYLEALILLTEGDFVYAAAIAAECKEQTSMNSSSDEVFKSLTSPLDSRAKEEEEETPLIDPENENAPLLGEESSQESLGGSLDDAYQAKMAPLIHLSPHFLKSAYTEYASELGLPKLLLDFDEMPPEVFNEWVPDENISKQILLSFLSQLGCLKNNRKKNWNPRYRKFVSDDVKFKLPNVGTGACNPVNSNVPDLGSILIEESAIRLSVLEQKKHFEKPHARKALDKLVKEYPGTDPEVIMETLVRCGFDVDAATACLVAGVLDFATFNAAADTSGFQPQASSTSASPQVSSVSTDHRTLLTGPPRLNVIIEEDEARRRSLTDKSKNNQTLAVRLRFHRLADQFPSFTKSYLAELFAQFGFNEDRVRHHLEAEGHKAQPTPSVLSLKEIEEPADSSPFPPSSISTDAAQSLNLLELEVADLRENIKQMKATLAKIRQTRTHPGVTAFYRDELQEMRLRLEYRLDLWSDLRVALSSQQQVAKKVAAEGTGRSQGPERRDSQWYARQWLTILDLHGLDLHHAMHALRQRLRLLESGCASLGTPLPPESASVASADAFSEAVRLPNHWLPKHLTVITGWGSSSPRLGSRKPSSTLRHNVINFLRTAAYDFEEMPFRGSGRFEVRLGAKQH